MGNAGTINVKVTPCDGGYLMMTSEDLPGLLLCGKDAAALVADLPNVVKKLFKLNYGMNVDIARGVSADSLGRKLPPEADITPRSWVAFPLQNCA